MDKVIENTNSMKQSEEWKPIPGFEGMYEVSTWGRVKSYLYSKRYKTSERILSPGKNNKGYYFVTLCKDNKKKKCTIHRLVAEAFIFNPSNFPQVNHKDEHKENNCVSNLEWCDCSYNNSYGTKLQRAAEKCSKSVVQLDKNGVFIAEYKSTQEASRVTSISQGNISSCCNHKYRHKSAGGFIWMYKDEYTAQTNQDQ